MSDREANRLGESDRREMRAAVAFELRGRTPSIAEDFNRCQRAAYRSIVGAPNAYSLRQSEVDEIADMCAAAILDAAQLPSIPSVALVDCWGLGVRA